jgi:chaperonin GroES
VIDQHPAPVPHPEYGTPTVDVLVPFGDRVVVLPDPPEEMIGSFYVPDVAQQRPARGTVVAVGPDVPDSIRLGQRVLYGHFTGTEALHGRAEVILMRSADLYAAIYPSTDAPPSDPRET